MAILRAVRSLEGHLGRLEPAFRADHLRRDRRHCQALVLLSVLAVLSATVASIWQFDGDPLLAGAVLAGAGLSILGLATLMFLQRTRTAAMLDAVVLSWATLFILGIAFFVGTAEVHAGFPGVMVVVIVLWNVLPQPLELRALTALLLSVPVVVVILGTMAGQPESAIADLLALLAANVFGAWYSIGNNRVARVRYRLLDISRRMRDRAARMQRLLPVCAWCGDLRDEAGYWRAVHEFVDSEELDTTARTICDQCEQGDHARGRRPPEADRVDAGSPESWEAARFRAARWQAAVLLGATVLITLGLLVEMLLERGAVAFSATAFQVRVLEVVICVLVLGVALRTRSRVLFDGVLTVWASLVSLAILVLAYQGAPTLTLSSVALATIAWALMLPVPRWQRAVPACMALLGGLLVCYGPAAPAELGPRAHQYAVALIAGLLVGFGFSTATERRRRELFEAARSARVEQRLVERLGELLPVCRVCHNVRDEDGYWRDVRAWLQSRAGGRATHGICGDCLRKEFGVEPDASGSCGPAASTA
ncbi:MAG: hypothetical protein U5R48_08940 [Gammaproteobacteria bacterium]|nr:hypothetical protein [Gammaproteobacteria bacterium]